MPADDTLESRAKSLSTQRQDILIEIAQHKKRLSMPSDLLKGRRVELFAKALSNILMDPTKGLAKSYLNLFVREIRIMGETLTMSGPKGMLAAAVASGDPAAAKEVRSYGMEWCAIGNESVNLWNMELDAT